MATGDLRERKRTAAMYRIQTAALDLFESRGFDEVTVEEIALATDVSASSIYRYFGTKEQIVLWDEFDPRLADLIGEAVAGAVPLEGVRRVVLAVLGELTAEDERRIARRTRLMMSAPSVEAASAALSYSAAEMIGDVLARQLGRPSADLEVQVFSHALIGGLLGMLHHWHGNGFTEPLRDALTRTFDIFEEGLDVLAGVGDTARTTAS